MHRTYEQTVKSFSSSAARRDGRIRCGPHTVFCEIRGCRGIGSSPGRNGARSSCTATSSSFRRMHRRGSTHPRMSAGSCSHGRCSLPLCRTDVEDDMAIDGASVWDDVGREGDSCGHERRVASRPMLSKPRSRSRSHAAPTRVSEEQKRKRPTQPC